jgi:transposase-like protein
MAESFVLNCPFCTAPSPELVSLFGSQLLLSQYRCSACGSYFEGLREDRWETGPVAPTSGGGNEDGARAEH